MQNHTNTFKPPEQSQPPTAKDTFNFVAGLFHLAVFTVGVFWAMIAKKPGTVGTRAYWFDLLCGLVLLLALSQNNWYPDQYLFVASMFLLPLLFFRHQSATLNQPHHVHTRCIGASRFGRGDNGKVAEFLIGASIGVAIALAGCEPYGLFIIASATANSLRQGMVEERDRQRAVQIADAMEEQQYMMDIYEKYQRQRPNR